MHWIALRWLPEPDQLLPSPEALGWWALQYTPRVCWVDEALLIEVSACERLWGGRLALMRHLANESPDKCRLQQAQGATSLEGCQVQGVGEALLLQVHAIAHGGDVSGGAGEHILR